MSTHNRTISVVGLGYVGLPLAHAFGKQKQTIGLDLNQTRIKELQSGHDRTHELTDDELKKTNILFSTNPEDLKKADFHIITVPTPINKTNKPDLSYMKGASQTVGAHIKPGDIVVFESTVYPGVTEDECVPELEAASKLKCGKDFFVGYSPERINPSDKVHTLTNIIKIVSGQNEETLNIVANVYESIIEAGVHRASSIKVAEAAKVIENTQRDLNIALINELSLIFHRVGISTHEVLEAAGTKWNFLPFKPGLVGGHCIGVDPYYLTHCAEQLGYLPEVILAGRRINDNMARFVAQETIKKMIQSNIKINGSKIAVLGLTFKENCPDLRNSKSFDIIKELQEYGVEILAHDPQADPKEAKHEYDIDMIDLKDIKKVDAIILCVAHDQYKGMSVEDFSERLNPNGYFVDVKNSFDQSEFSSKNISYWCL